MRKYLVALVCLVAVGCGSDKVTFTLPPSETNIEGTFLLTLADGRVPPYAAFFTSTDEWDLTSDRLYIVPGGTWADTTFYTVFSLRDGSSEPRATATAGTYSVSNSQIHFTMTTGGTSVFDGAVKSNILYVLFNGVQYQYKR